MCEFVLFSINCKNLETKLRANVGKNEQTYKHYRSCNLIVYFQLFYIYTNANVFYTMSLQLGGAVLFQNFVKYLETETNERKCL